MKALVQTLVFSGTVLGFALPATGLTMDWTPIGNPGNACDPQSQGCFGAVGYAYSIGTYEVTNAQYAEFLTAKAASDPLGLYNTDMTFSKYGGIARQGSPGSYAYHAIAGRADMPVNFVSFYDALRFANWMSNGQGSGDTETGSYTLLGGAAIPSNGLTVTRNPDATIVLPSEDEWYKAAYYSALTTSYFDYPAGTDTPTLCGTPTATANHANCGFDPGGGPLVDNVTIKGSYPGSASPYGTFDQGGNVYEYNETILGSDRVIRGGAFGSHYGYLAAFTQYSGAPEGESGLQGFRIAMVPEPDTGLLVMLGVLGLAIRRRRPASEFSTPS